MQNFAHDYSAADIRPEFVMSICVCLSVGLSVCSHASPESQLETNFTNFSKHAIRGSFSGGVTMCYVLPVLWMTLCLHTMAMNRRREKWRTLKVTRHMAEPTVLLRLSKHPTTLFAIQAALLRITGWIKASGITILT